MIAEINPRDIPTRVDVMRGQFFFSRKNAYGNQTLQFSTVNNGINNEPWWPERLRRIWSTYEKYVRIAVVVATHPIVSTVFWFITPASLCAEEPGFLQDQQVGAMLLSQYVPALDSRQFLSWRLVL